MSVLTKVFVVLVTVLAVAAAVLMSVFAANVQNYRQAYQDQAAQTKTLANEITTKNGLVQAAQDKAKDLEAKLSALSTELNNQIQRITGERDTAQAEVGKIKNEKTALEAAVKQNSASLSQNQEILLAAQAELKDLRAQAIKLQNNVVELVGKNTDLDNTRKNLEVQARKLQEQVAGVENELAQVKKWWDQVPGDIKRGITQTGGGEVAQAIPAPNIRGQITRIEKLDGETLAQINIGSADRVAPNMEFMIHRGDKFLGNLVIKVVDDHAAVGTIRLAQDKIKEGDRVMGSQNAN